MTFFADQPISKKSEDTLFRGRFAEQLAKAISEWKSQEPFIIGIYGSWGDGKTSVLNLLAEYLQNQYVVTFFDPWYFNSQEELIKSFFSEISRVVVEKLPWFSKMKFSYNTRKLSKSLTSIPFSFALYGISLDPQNLILHFKNPIDLKEDLINGLIERRRYDQRKIVILIDNLDRLTSDEILLVLKLIRLCSDFQDFIYILAFDDNYVIQALNHSLSINNSDHLNGEDYLKKIIQTSIRLPALDSKRIDDFINNALEELCIKHNIKWEYDFLQRFPQFYQQHMRGILIQNLRDAKKYINAVSFTIPLVINEVNYADWLVMEAIRVFCPSSYKLVKENIDLLSPDYPILSYIWNDHDRKENNQRYQDFSEKIEDKFKKFTNASLIFLFPVFSAWKLNPNNPTLLSQSEYSLYSSLQCIASPDYRDAYFQFGPEPGQLPDAYISEFFNKLNQFVNESEIHTFLKNQILELKENGQLKLFFDKLIVRANRIPRHFDQAIVKTLSKLVNFYSKERSLYKDSEEDRAQALIFSIIAQNTNFEKTQLLLETSIIEANTDYFATSFVYFCGRGKNNILNYDLIDQNFIKEKLRIRLRNFYYSNDRDIFYLPRNEYAYILIRWAGPLLLDKDFVSNYLEKIFYANPKRIGKFLEIFVMSDPLSEDSNSYLVDFNEFNEAFSLDWLKQIFTQFPDIEFDIDREKWALERFKKELFSAAP